MALRKKRRRGVVLLVVLSLLIMFFLAGVTFIVVAGNYQRTSVSISRHQQTDDPPQNVLDGAMAPLYYAGDVMVTFNSQGSIDRLHLGHPSPKQFDDFQLAGVNPTLLPRTVRYPLNPVRITLGNGSPDKPEEAMGLLVTKGREHRPRRVPLSIAPPGAAGPGHESSGVGD